MINPDVKGFFDPATNTVTYVVSDPTSKACVIIDPVLDYAANSGRTSTHSADNIVNYVKSQKLETHFILETHAHADHLSAAPYLRKELSGKTAIGEHIPDVQKIFKDVFNLEQGFEVNGRQFDLLIKENDVIEIGALRLKALYTPGHTPACMSYIIGDAAFVGDTLFMTDYGTARCDFPGGDARTLYRSIHSLFKLPGETRVFLCHDYLPKSRTHYVWETTIEQQRENNIHVKNGITEDEFVAMREARDKTLDLPKLLLPSVQVNIRAGALPPAEDNGTRYLKIPLNTV